MLELKDIPEYARKGCEFCIVCGAPATCADLTPVGQIYYGLCAAHSHYICALSFGPQFMEDARMEIIPLPGKQN